MYSEKYLNKDVEVVIDRKLWTKHPKYDFVYQLNYGFIPKTMAPDGEEIDAYVLGITEAIDKCNWTCIAIIKRINDDDDKLIVVEKWKKYTDDEIKKATHFQEKFFESIIIR